LSSREGTVLFC